MQPLENIENKRLSVAPMIDWTTADYRYFAHLLNPRWHLYTEMISTNALLHGDTARLLRHQNEHPLVLQLGGSQIDDLVRCAQIGQAYGYDEINLNVGCPSDRVQHFEMGACLMAKPNLVAKAVAAMQQAVDIPVTVKHRIGIDHHDSYDFMYHFVDTVAAAGCTRFIVHARIAWLQGLSPKQNRDIPPLRYDDVYRLKQDFGHLCIEINGGIDTLDAICEHLTHVDGVMIGRAAYHNPYLIAQSAKLWGDLPPSRLEVIEQLGIYLQARIASGEPLTAMVRHYLGLFQGVPGARRYRQALSGKSHLSLEDFKAAANIPLLYETPS